jgi:glycosyltransferase involved in cell wall biosynthesis/GR25 family glycosyltransferase involved in LPS biosynthesis
MSIFREAIKAYKNQEYHKALKLFEKVTTIYGSELVKANIKLCKKYLINQPAPKEINNIEIVSTINEYFDEIYLVNLKKEAKRRLAAISHLQNEKINFSIYEATDGNYGNPFKTYQTYTKRELGELNRYKQFKDSEIKRAKPFIESPGAVGYIYTYISILRDAKLKKHKKILILEDDVVLDFDFHRKFNFFVKSIPKEWKILQLGSSQYKWDSVNEKQALEDGWYYPRQLDTCGSFAIAIDHSIFDELIEAVSSFESPFDHLALGELYERYIGECYVCYPNIVMPDVANSSIRNKRNQLEHSLKMRWIFKNFPYPLPAPSIAIFIQNSNNIKYFECFDSIESMPFDLRLYLYTEDGPRPVHNSDIFLKENYQPLELPSCVNIPYADFVAKVCPEDVLSESEIITYIESELLGKENKTFLKKIINNATTEVKGRVSVIIPTFKRSKNLEKAISSVIEQRYQNKEIIVISDNGTSSQFNIETIKIIEKIKENNPLIDITLIEHKFNRNGSAARNTGLLRATGEFICFLDDDDIYLNNRIEDTIKKLIALPKTVGAVYCGFVGWNSPENDQSRYKAGDLSLELLLLDYKSHYLHTNTTAYRRSALNRINGFDETYRRHQDIELNLRFFRFFTTDFVSEIGVRLNPEVSEVNNKIFNSEILNLKQKFLSQYSYLVSQFNFDIQSRIYDKHWEEVAKYITDTEEIKAYIKSLRLNGAVQILLRSKNYTS